MTVECKNCKCSTNKSEIEKLFSEKLNPAIAPALEKRDAINRQREQIETERQTFLKKVESTKMSIVELEETLDARVVAGKPFDDVTAKIAAKKAEESAYMRHGQRLGERAGQCMLSEKEATAELSEAIGKALEAMRPDVSALVEGKLWEVVGTLVFFESCAREVLKQNGAVLDKNLEKSVFRFLNLEAAQTHLEAFTGNIGEDFSVVRRRDAAIYYFALLEQKRKAAERPDAKPESAKAAERAPEAA